MKAFLDGDIVVFRAGFAAERNIWHLAWGPMRETAPDGSTSEVLEFRHIKMFEYKKEAMEHLDKVMPGKFSRVEGEDYKLFPERELEPLSHALNNVRTTINYCLEKCDINEFDLVVCLSGGGDTFRHRLATTRPYKGNRKVEHRPTYEKEIRDYIRATYHTVLADDEEADDLMAIGQTTEGPEASVILTLDKDLNQVPGLKYNWVHDARYAITPAQAAYNFHMQLMTGDSTDNIPGLPGIGPGKAAKALHGMDDPIEQFHEVCRQYQIHSGKEDWLEYLVEQGRLVYIRRIPGEMWEPPLFTEPDLPWGEMELTMEAD